MNKTNTSTCISKKINKNNNAYRLLGILCFTIGKNMFCHWECIMPTFTGSKLYNEKKPDCIEYFFESSNLF